MGSAWYKLHHKVIEVSPLPRESDISPPGDRDRSPGTDSWLVAAGECVTRGHLRAASRGRRSELPPLKEARSGTGALPSLRQVPRSISIDIRLDMEEKSIVKNHPPRRFQRLEPINSSTVISPEKLLEKQRAANTHKSQTICLQEQTERKRSLHLETHNNKQKIKDLEAKKVREREQNNNRQEDPYYIAIECDETFNTNDDNRWNELFSPMLFINDRSDNNNHFRIPKQLVKHQTLQDNSSNSSSNDSLDCWMNNNRQSQHRLMRTKTERILVFDEFFDQEL